MSLALPLKRVARGLVGLVVRFRGLDRLVAGFLASSVCARVAPPAKQSPAAAKSAISVYVHRGLLYWYLRRSSSRNAFAETFDLLLGLVLGDPVLLLDLADELVALAGDDVDVVVGELAPLLLHLARELLPVAFDAVPVHV